MKEEIKEEDKIYLQNYSLIFVLFILKIADVLTTYCGVFFCGAIELNPLMRPFLVSINIFILSMSFIFSTFLFLFIYVNYKVHHNFKSLKFINRVIFFLIIFLGIVVINNFIWLIRR